MRPEAITASITWRIVHNLFVLVVSRDCLANIGGGGKSWTHDLSAANSHRWELVYQMRSSQKKSCQAGKDICISSHIVQTSYQV